MDDGFTFIISAPFGVFISVALTTLRLLMPGLAVERSTDAVSWDGERLARIFFDASTLTSTSLTGSPTIIISFGRFLNSRGIRNPTSVFFSPTTRNQRAIANAKANLFFRHLKGCFGQFFKNILL